MGYYASGSGNILFSRVLSNEEYSRVIDLLKEEFTEVGGIREWQPWRAEDEKKVTCVDFVHPYENYHEDGVEESLNIVAGEFGPIISEGCISFRGDGDADWRYVYNPTSQKWDEQDGHVEYYDFTCDLLLKALSFYLKRDEEILGKEEAKKQLEMALRETPSILDHLKKEIA